MRMLPHVLTATLATAGLAVCIAAATSLPLSGPAEAQSSGCAALVAAAKKGYRGDRSVLNACKAAMKPIPRATLDQTAGTTRRAYRRAVRESKLSRGTYDSYEPTTQQEIRHVNRNYNRYRRIAPTKTSAYYAKIANSHANAQQRYRNRQATQQLLGEVLGVMAGMSRGGRRGHH